MSRIPTGNNDNTESGSSTNLLMANTHTKSERTKCHELLRNKPLSDVNLLVTTYTKSPDVWLDEWHRRNRQLPDEMRLISVGEMTRSASRSDAPRTVEIGSLPVETLPDPEDVSELGVRISKQLEEWEGNGNTTVACFDSVSNLLEYVDLQTAFRFLYLVTRRFKFAETDGVSHFHLDPELHDDTDVKTLKVLFDATVDVTSE